MVRVYEESLELAVGVSPGGSESLWQLVNVGSRGLGSGGGPSPLPSRHLNDGLDPLVCLQPLGHQTLQCVWMYSE